MKRIRNVLYRYRLMTSILALVVLLGAVAVTPVQADMTCAGGCVNWTKADGCIGCSYCCSYTDGSWWCQDEPGWACD